MGMNDELKQVQDSRIAGKETSTTIDPGPFGDITPLDKPEEKAAEKEPDEEEVKEEKEPVETGGEPEESEEEDDEVPPEKIEATIKKYKTPEEAAKAAYNAQKRMHAATSETARLKKENDDLRRERQSYPPPPVQAPKPEIPIEDAIADKFYAEIERLPDDAPERDKKVVKLMARMNAEISEATRQASDRKSSEIDQHIKNVEARAKELGLEDNLLDDFWIYAGNAPKHLRQDEAIQWTIERLDRLRGNEDEVKEKTLEKVRSDEKEKKKMAPLGKGGIKPIGVKSEEERELSLGEALREVSRQRIHR